MGKEEHKIQDELGMTLDKLAAGASAKVPVMEEEISDTEEVLEPEPAAEAVPDASDEVARDLKSLRGALAMAKIGDLRGFDEAEDALDRIETNFQRILVN